MANTYALSLIVFLSLSTTAFAQGVSTSQNPQRPATTSQGNGSTGFVVRTNPSNNPFKNPITQPLPPAVSAGHPEQNNSAPILAR